MDMFLVVTEDPFVNFRKSLGLFLIAVLGLVMIVTLAKAVYLLMKGERDAAGRFFIWILSSAAGIIILSGLLNA